MALQTFGPQGFSRFPPPGSTVFSVPGLAPGPDDPPGQTLRAPPPRVKVRLPLRVSAQYAVLKMYDRRPLATSAVCMPSSHPDRRVFCSPSVGQVSVHPSPPQRRVTRVFSSLREVTRGPSHKDRRPRPCRASLRKNFPAYKAPDNGINTATTAPPLARSVAASGCLFSSNSSPVVSIPWLFFDIFRPFPPFLLMESPYHSTDGSPALSRCSPSYSDCSPLHLLNPALPTVGFTASEYVVSLASESTGL